MRARMAIKSANISVDLREVVLRDKPAHMLEVSPKGTVPVLLLPDGRVIDESRDVMLWALEQNDPEAWMPSDAEVRGAMLVLVDQCENDFKPHLDRYKYAARYEGADPTFHRAEAERFLAALEGRLEGETYLFGKKRSFADIAIAPFIRQFVNASTDWFPDSPYRNIKRWLNDFVESDIFKGVMTKYPQWREGDERTLFPDAHK